jgi:hypothetical protein
MLVFRCRDKYSVTSFTDLVSDFLNSADPLSIKREYISAVRFVDLWGDTITLRSHREIDDFLARTDRYRSIENAMILLDARRIHREWHDEYKWLKRQVQEEFDAHPKRPL